MADKADKGGFVKLIKGKTDKLVVIGIGLVVVILGYLYLDEVSTPDPQEKEAKPIDPKAKISAEDDTHQNVLALVKPLTPIESSEYEALMRFNPFDPQEAKKSKQLEKDVDQLVQQAQQLFDQGKYPEAKEQAEQAIKIVIGHKGARALLDEIKKKLEPVATPAGKKPGAKPAAAGKPGGAASPASTPATKAASTPATSSAPTTAAATVAAPASAAAPAAAPASGTTAPTKP